MTLHELVSAGHTFARKPKWGPDDTLQITILDEKYLGPWAKLYSPGNEICDQENPHTVLIIGDKGTDWEPAEPLKDEP